MCAVFERTKEFLTKDARRTDAGCHNSVIQ